MGQIGELKKITEPIEESLFYQMFKNPGVYFKRLFKHTMIIGVLTFALSWVYIHSDYYQVQIPSTMHSLIGIVIGLLLVFRTNTAYDRWWEGRKCFSQMSSSVTFFAIKLNSTVSDTAMKMKIRKLIKEFLWNLSDYLKSGVGFSAEFHKKQITIVEGIMRILSDAVKAGHLTERDLGVLEKSLGEMVEQSNTFERIKNTPIPLSYKLHIKASITVYLMTLPFGLFHDLGLWACAMVMLIYYVVGGIEIISAEIENPFAGDPNDLPIDTYFAEIRGSLVLIKEEANVEYGKASQDGENVIILNARMTKVKGKSVTREQLTRLAFPDLTCDAVSVAYRKGSEWIEIGPSDEISLTDSPMVFYATMSTPVI